MDTSKHTLGCSWGVEGGGQVLIIGINTVSIHCILLKFQHNTLTKSSTRLFSINPNNNLYRYNCFRIKNLRTVSSVRIGALNTRLRWVNDKMKDSLSWYEFSCLI